MEHLILYKTLDMKHINRYIAWMLLALMPMYIFAQDGRQRDFQTMIADGLAQLPISEAQKREKVMAEMANTGAKGMEMLTKMLVPADKGKNSVVEYAISGVIDYVTLVGTETQRNSVKKGLIAGIDGCTDNVSRAFLMSQLQLCSTIEDAPVYIKYLKDDYLADYAIRGLVATKGSEEIILELMRKEGAPRKVLSHAAYECELKAAEPILLEWLKRADKDMQNDIFKALSVCGTSASLKVLSAAAKKETYIWSKDRGATAAYFELLKRLAVAGEGEKTIKGSKILLKNDAAYLRGAALDVILSVKGSKGMSYVHSALKDKDIEVRNSALRSISLFADNNVYATVAGWIPSLSDEACVDVVNWLGNHHISSQVGAVIKAMQSRNDALAMAGIAAAGRIGGQDALNALIAQLDGKYANKATAALLSFNGDIKEGLKTALDGNVMTQVQALKICSKRCIYEVSEQVFTLLHSDNEEVKSAAYDALSNVVVLDDFDRLSKLLTDLEERYIVRLQNAMKSAIKTQSSAKQHEIVASYMTKSSSPSLYYPILAQTNTLEAIQLLNEEFLKKNKEAAFKALLEIDRPEMIDVLYRIASEKKASKDLALLRYSSLVSTARFTDIRKYQLYRQALELSPSVNVQNQILGKLASVRTFPSLMLAVKYLDKKETASTAAATVKIIVAKNNEHLGGASVRTALEKAQAIYKTLPGSDAGYAVDEITNLLVKLPNGEYSSLLDGTMNGWKAKTNAAGWATSTEKMSYAGNGSSIVSTKKDYENFEMYIDWRTVGKAGIAVRSIPKIGLGTEGGSGTLLGNKIKVSKPLANADNRRGEWNTLYIKVVDDRVTTVLNGQMVSKKVILENSCEPDSPAYITGKIELMSEGVPVEFRDIYIRELPSTPVYTLSLEEKKAGYEMLFDGTSLHKWTGNTHSYITENGTIYVEAGYGSGGNLYTKKEYSDFVLRFEFSFERDGVNNGIGIRTPMGVDAAYHGMEIQLLDHDSPIYKGLHAYQQHGSVYGIIPAERVKFGPLGSWNTEEIRAVGDHITVTVNGKVILDGNIREACQGNNVSKDGSGRNPYTIDHLNHPGLFNKKGHIGFCGHGVGIRFRNVRVLDLSSQAAK